MLPHLTRPADSSLVRRKPGDKLLRILLVLVCLFGPVPRGWSAQGEWQVFKVDSVRVFATAPDRKNAWIIVRHLTLDGLPIADELGTHRLPRVDIYLAPSPESFRELVGATLADWAGAVAIPDQRRIVLKSPRWERNSDLVETLLHELTHAIVAEVAGSAHVPAWLNEGLAMYYSGRPVYRDARLVGRALVSRSLVPLTQIDHVLRFRRAKAALAYQESLEAVTYLIQRYGPGAPADILTNLSRGEPFDVAFERAIGQPFRLFELDLIQHWRKVHRWDLFQDLAWIGWILLVVLAVVVYALIRRRNVRRMAEWETEENRGEGAYWLYTTFSSEPGLDLDRDPERPNLGGSNREPKGGSPAPGT